MAKALRKDWMPQDRTEVCACITVLALNGNLTPDDEQFIAGWILWRRAHRRPSEPANG